MTGTTTREAALRELHASLGLRRRPEDIAHLILGLFAHDETAAPVPGSLRRALRRAAEGSLHNLWREYASTQRESALRDGAHRRSRRPAEPLPALPALPDVPGPAADDPRRIEEAVRAAGQEMAERLGARRQDDGRSRPLRRTEAKLARLLAERRKGERPAPGTGGLAASLPYDRFAADTATAAFIAYLTARNNQRSEYTVSGQQRAYDELAEALFRRLRDRPGSTDWFAVAHARPTAEVVARLTERQRGELLGRCHRVLRDVAGLLEAAWERQPFDRATMIVRRGDDSTGWNSAARAWSTARADWFALLRTLGAQDITEHLCPGKVPPLVAPDVAAWHRRVVGAPPPDTPVWAELPLPWRVLRGEEPCPRSLVARACRRHGVDPVASGWTEPRRTLRHARFRPTPDLVRGVTTADPQLAHVLHAAGVFPPHHGG
ncbi:hypothetical protein [Streptomyces sp. NPDC049881]|uniref:hypothetical protein n=1 Tax=Streptomyces sp. NPDC049881 TaxID=3155778 RepID=UPI00342CBC60